MRRRAGAVLVALLVGASVGVFAPATAHAAPGGAMAAALNQNGGATVTGTAGDDLLVIGHDADVFTHNRFAAGDPGFVSARDFDSTTAGEQTVSVLNNVLFNALEGDDTLQVVGTFPGYHLNTFFGAGYDTLDLSNYATSVDGVVSGADMSARWDDNLDKIIGSPYSDDLVGSPAEAAVPLTVLAGAGNDQIQGTNKADVLDGGPGFTDMSGAAGDDTLTIEAPFDTKSHGVDGSPGDDTLVIRGSLGADDVDVYAGDNVIGVVDPDVPAGGYRANAEHVRIELRDGNDQLSLDRLNQSVVVDAGAGTDSVAMEAGQATAKVATDGATRTVTLPNLSDNPQSYPLTSVEHLSIANETLIATAPGPGGGPHVRTFRSDGTPVVGFMAYDPVFTGGVNVALGDVDGDLDDEIITAPGPGGGPHVRVFHSDGSPVAGFMAYDPRFTGGVTVTTADLDGDGVAEIVTIPTDGGGSDVRIWSGSGALRDEFLADGLQVFGRTIARGSARGKAGAEQLSTNFNGRPSSIRTYEADGTPAANVQQSFAPYGTEFGGTISVARAEIGRPEQPRDGSHDDLVTGAGPGGGPHVRTLARDANGVFQPVGSFYAYDPNFHGGVAVATCDIDGIDDEVLTAAGAGGGPHVRMFTKTGTPLELSFMAYDPIFHGGVRIACGGAETKQY